MQVQEPVINGNAVYVALVDRTNDNTYAFQRFRVFQTASVKAEWNPVKTLPVLSGTGMSY